MLEYLKIKNDYNKAVAEHRLNMLCGFREAPEVEIKEIPKVRTKFPGSKNSYWYLEKNDYLKTDIIYELGAREVFNTHLHKIPKETIEILTPNSYVEWVTERGISCETTGNIFHALPQERHALVSLSDHTIKMRVSWSPAITGWDAIFQNVKLGQNYLNK